MVSDGKLCFAFPLQEEGSGGPWEHFEKAKGLRYHEGHAHQEVAGWQKGTKANVTL